MNTQAQDALLRDQIVGSCRLVKRHIEGIVQDTTAIITMPSYKTGAEDALNQAERVISLAAKAISAAKAEMGKKQLETT
jgi:histidine ammonia-lyase